MIAKILNSRPRRLTLAILALAALLPLTWFPVDKIILNGDPFFVLDPARAFVERFSLWQEKINLGAEQKVEVATLIHTFIQALPAFLGASDRVAEIFHLTFWFVLPGLTIAMFMAALCRRLKISEWAIPPTVVFYLFNLYRMANFGDNNHFVIYATLPLLLYIVTLAAEDMENWKVTGVGFGLATLLAAQSGTNPPMYLMLWLPVLIYGVTLTFGHWRQGQSLLRFWLLAAATTLLFNLFWLVPFVQVLQSQSGLVSAGNLDWLNDLSKHTSFGHVIRLIGAWGWFDSWRGDRYAPFALMYEIPLWYHIALLPAVMAAGALAFRRGRQPLVLAIAGIAIIGLVFAQGTHPPLDRFFRWCVEHVPFFWSFRSPWYKFSNMEVFGLAVLLGIFIGLVCGHLEQKKKLSFLVIPVVIGPIMVMLALVDPMLTGRMWTRMEDVIYLAPQVVSYPSTLRQAADWLNDQPGNGGVALLPYQGAAIYRWGFATMIDPIVNFTRRPVFLRGDRIGYAPGFRPGASQMYYVFKESLYADKPEAEAIARSLGIEFIVQRNDLDYAFYDDTDSPEFVRDRLRQLPNTKLVKSFGELDIYQLSSSQANQAYATSQVRFDDGHPVDSFAEDLTTQDPAKPFPAIFYDRPIAQANRPLIDKIVATINPDQTPPTLQVKASNGQATISGQADQPFVLVYNQSTSPNWIAKAKNAQLEGPVVANGYAPAWLVQPDGDFTITIDYRPQRTFAVTGVISLLAIIGAIVWLFNRRRLLLLNRK